MLTEIRINIDDLTFPNRLVISETALSSSNHSICNPSIQLDVFKRDSDTTALNGVIDQIEQSLHQVGSRVLDLTRTESRFDEREVEGRAIDRDISRRRNRSRN